jgi:hypothetical protein
VAISTTFGQNTLELFRVWADEVKELPPLSRAGSRYVEPVYRHVGNA